MSEGRVIPVEIHGQRYPIRSTLDPVDVAQLASYVDEKIKAAGETTPTGDSVRLAELAALNIADEVFRARGDAKSHQTDLTRRTAELERMLDLALAGDAAAADMAALAPTGRSF